MEVPQATKTGRCKRTNLLQGQGLASQSQRGPIEIQADPGRQGEDGDGQGTPASKVTQIFALGNLQPGSPAAGQVGQESRTDVGQGQPQAEVKQLRTEGEEGVVSWFPKILPVFPESYSWTSKAIGGP
jgi:hypothetical protein